MRVTETADRDAAAKVKIAFARNVKQIAARAVAEDEIVTAVAGHDVLAEQLAHRLELVVNDGWRNDFFHFAGLNRRDAKTQRKKFIKRFPFPHLRP